MIKKILCIVGVMDQGGAETFLMKIYRKLDKTKYQMDFCVTEEKEGFYHEEIEKMGGKIHRVTRKTQNPIKSYLEIMNLVKENNYKNIIRISSNSITVIDLLAAKMGGAKNLIFRSSNSNNSGNKMVDIIHKLFKPLARVIPNVKIAPSDLAAIHMFGKKEYNNGKITLLNNGLDIEKFKYNENYRNEIRNKYNIADKTMVIGHIGRFSEQKNHKFLINVFEKYKNDKNNDSILMLIGKGELEDNIKEMVKEKGMDDSVFFLGTQKEVNKYYQAFDLVVFPSLYEGMPNVIIEAQCSGLNCVLSDTITKQANLTNRLNFLSLNSSLEEWTYLIKKSEEREKVYLKLMEQNYDIDYVTKLFVEKCFKY
ncbi:MAG: glycosyltransferase [Erysipelotrichaceae bacterium]